MVEVFGNDQFLFLYRAKYVETTNLVRCEFTNWLLVNRILIVYFVNFQKLLPLPQQRGYAISNLIMESNVNVGLNISILNKR